MLADATMVIHFAFLAYVVAGGFIAWWRPVAFWPHLVLVGWGFSTVVFGLNCPLTYVENWARQRAHMPLLETGFIDHYLTGVLYPRSYSTLVLVLAAVVISVSWVGAFTRWRHHHHQSISHAHGHSSS